MSRLFAYILFLSLFLLVACNEEKNESSPLKSGEILLDVNAENFALNGKVIGNTIEDIYHNDDYLIKSLDDEMKKLNLQLGENSAKYRIRFSEDVYYNEFFKVLHTFFKSNDFLSVRYTIGSNANEVYSLDLSKDFMKKRIEDCWTHKQLRKIFTLILYGKEYFLKSVNIDDPQYKSSRLECIRNYMNLSVVFPIGKAGFKYKVVFDEMEADSPQLYELKTEDELWNILKSVRENGNLQNKKDYDYLTIWISDLDTDYTLKMVEPLIKGATKLGYRLFFGYFE